MKKLHINEENKRRLESTHARVRAAMTPAQLATSDAVQTAVDGENAELDRRFEAENKLRAWAKGICGVSLDMSEIEQFRSECRSQASGSLFYFQASRGTSQPLYKTQFGTIDSVENYVKTLERTVIDITNNSQFTALPFSGLIKLAFKRLFTRNK